MRTAQPNSEAAPPRIGVTCSPRRAPGYYAAYFRALKASGAEPVAIAPWLEDADGQAGAVLSSLDGLLMPGGWDVDPETYGERRPPGITDVDAALDRSEMELVRAAGREGVPVFGICRGLQVINVALGGTLHQHVEGHDLGDQPPDRLAHAMVVDTDCELAEAIDATSVMVNSQHHQAVRMLAPSLRATARSPDGTIEAVESPYRMVVAVQCHPEELIGTQPWALSLLSRFVERSRASASARMQARRAPAGE